MIEKSSKANNSTFKEFLFIFFGSALFAASVNLFVVPIGLYTCGVVGVAQLLRTLIVYLFDISFSFDIAGIINYLINIPLLVFCFFKMGRKFFFGTLFSVTVQTVFFTLVPVLNTPVLNDPLSNVICAGILGGIGCSMVLMGRCCAGGLDIVGVYTSMNNFSIGKLTMLFNAVLYLICAVIFDVQVAIYSVFYIVIFSLILDRYYALNTEISLMIISSKKEVATMIMNDYKRGVTEVDGKGAYTGEDKKVYISVISEFEKNEIQRKIREIDPNAFIIATKNVQVNGGYEVRLV